VATSPFEPVGTIIAYAGDAITQQATLKSSGWLLCDGSEFDKDGEFQELFAAIGTAFGGTSSTFNVPWLQGVFLRGVSPAASSSDPDVASRTAMQPGGNIGPKVGSYQGYGTAPPRNTFQGRFKKQYSKSCAKIAGPDAATFGSGTNTATVSGGDFETRPWNKYVHFLIKYAELTFDQDYVEIPVGSVLAFAGPNFANSNSSWLSCNGDDYPPDNIADLNKAIGFAHGKAQNGNLVVPDYCGYFLRGVSADSGYDPDATTRVAPYSGSGAQSGGNTGNNVGSMQRFATASSPNGFTATVDKQLGGNNDKRGQVSGEPLCKWNGNNTTITLDGGGDKESRPTNMSVDYFIRSTVPDESLLPAGFVIAFAGNPASVDLGTRWLLCDGKATYNAAEFPDLFGAIGNIYGGAPNSGMFAVPNYQGQFLRGADRGANVDPDVPLRTYVGTAPSGAQPGDPGTLQPSATSCPQGSNKFTFSVPNLPIDTFNRSGGGASDSPAPTGNDYQNVSVTGGDGDTRPKNVYVYFLIKSTNS
jgi:microcystin-dependent protein